MERQGQTPGGIVDPKEIKTIVRNEENPSFSSNFLT
jgi:hypothetical protein